MADDNVIKVQLSKVDREDLVDAFKEMIEIAEEAEELSKSMQSNNEKVIKGSTKAANVATSNIQKTVDSTTKAIKQTVNTALTELKKLEKMKSGITKEEKVKIKGENGKTTSHKVNVTTPYYQSYEAFFNKDEIKILETAEKKYEQKRRSIESKIIKYLEFVQETQERFETDNSNKSVEPLVKGLYDAEQAEAVADRYIEALKKKNVKVSKIENSIRDREKVYNAYKTLQSEGSKIGTPETEEDARKLLEIMSQQVVMAQKIKSLTEKIGHSDQRFDKINLPKLKGNTRKYFTQMSGQDTISKFFGKLVTDFEPEYASFNDKINKIVTDRDFSGFMEIPVEDMKKDIDKSLKEVETYLKNKKKTLNSMSDKSYHAWNNLGKSTSSIQTEEGQWKFVGEISNLIRNGFKLKEGHGGAEYFNKLLELNPDMKEFSKSIIEFKEAKPNEHSVGGASSSSSNSSTAINLQEIDSKLEEVKKRAKEVLSDISKEFANVVAEDQGEKYYKDRFAALEKIKNELEKIKELSKGITIPDGHETFERKNTENNNLFNTIEQVITQQDEAIHKIYDNIDFETKRAQAELERRISERQSEIIQRINNNKDFSKYGESNWLQEYINKAKESTDEIDTIYAEFEQRLEQRKSEILEKEAKEEDIKTQRMAVESFLQGKSPSGAEEFAKNLEKYVDLLELIEKEGLKAEEVIRRIQERMNDTGEGDSATPSFDDGKGIFDAKKATNIDELYDMYKMMKTYQKTIEDYPRTEAAEDARRFQEEIVALNPQLERLLNNWEKLTPKSKFKEVFEDSFETTTPPPSFDQTNRLKELVNKTTISFEELKEIISALPDNKIAQLNQVLDRTEELTSDTGTSLEVMTSNLGKFFKISGTRSEMSFFLNNNGEFTRKPNKNKTEFTNDRLYTKNMKYDQYEVADIARNSSLTTQIPQVQNLEEDYSKLNEEIERWIDNNINRQMNPPAYNFDDHDNAIKIMQDYIDKMNELKSSDGYSALPQSFKDNIISTIEYFSKLITTSQNAIKLQEKFNRQNMLDDEIRKMTGTTAGDEYNKYFDMLEQEGIEISEILEQVRNDFNLTFDEVSQKWAKIPPPPSTENAAVQVEELTQEVEELTQAEIEAAQKAKEIGKVFGITNKEALKDIQNVLLEYNKDSSRELQVDENGFLIPSANQFEDELDIFADAGVGFTDVLNTISKYIKLSETDLDSYLEKWKEVRKYVSNSKIRLEDGMTSEWGDDYKAKRATIGVNNVKSNEGTNINLFLEELNEVFGKIFETENVSEKDAFNQLYEYLKDKPVVVNPDTLPDSIRDIVNQILNGTYNQKTNHKYNYSSPKFKGVKSRNIKEDIVSTPETIVENEQRQQQAYEDTAEKADEKAERVKKAEQDGTKTVEESAKRVIKENEETEDNASFEAKTFDVKKASNLKELREQYKILTEINEELKQYANISDDSLSVNDKFNKDNLEKFKQELIELNPQLELVIDSTEKMSRSDFGHIFHNLFDQGTESIQTPVTTVEEIGSQVQKDTKYWQEYNDEIAFGLDRIERINKLKNAGITDEHALYKLASMRGDLFNDIDNPEDFNVIKTEGQRSILDYLWTELIKMFPDVNDKTLPNYNDLETFGNNLKDIFNIDPSKTGFTNRHGVEVQKGEPRYGDAYWTHFATYDQASDKRTDYFNEDVIYKVYATFEDISNLNKETISSIMTALTQAGFKGQLKVPGKGSIYDDFQGYHNDGGRIFSSDQLVIHGINQDMQKIAYEVLSKMFPDMFSYISGGIDAPEGSFSQLLASGNIEKYVKRNINNNAKFETPNLIHRENINSEQIKKEQEERISTENTTDEEIQQSVQETAEVIEDASDTIDDANEQEAQSAEETADAVVKAEERKRKAIEETAKTRVDNLNEDLMRPAPNELDPDEFEDLINKKINEIKNTVADNGLAKYDITTDEKEQPIGVKITYKDKDTKRMITEMYSYKKAVDETGESVGDTEDAIKQLILVGKKFSDDEITAEKEKERNKKEIEKLKSKYNKRLSSIHEKFQYTPEYKTAQDSIGKIVDSDDISEVETAFNKLDEFVNTFTQDIKKSAALDPIYSATKTKDNIDNVVDYYRKRFIQLGMTVDETETKIANLVLSADKIKNIKLTDEDGMDNFRKEFKIFNTESEKFDGEIRISRMDNSINKQVENAYKKLASTEEKYLTLLAKEQAGIATDKQLLELKELTAEREKAYNTTKKKTASTTEEIAAQQRYNDVLQQSNGVLDKYIDREQTIKTLMDDSSNMLTGFANNSDKQNIDGFDDILEHYKKKVDDLNNKLLETKNPTTATFDKYKKDILKISKELDSVVIGNVDPDNARDEIYRYASTLKNVELGTFNEQTQSLNVKFSEQKGVVKEVILKYDQMTGAIQRIEKESNNAKGKLNSFFTGLKKRFTSLAQYLLSFASFYEVFGWVKQGVSVIRELDVALTEMRKVSDETISSLNNFQSVSFDVAGSIGATAVQIQNSAADFMRLGYSLKEASELAKDANIYANVGDMEINEATEHMISSIKAWESEFSSEVEASEAIVDRYNEIGLKKPIRVVIHGRKSSYIG